MRYLILFFTLIFFSACQENMKPVISEFRGPDRSGIFNETGLLKTWPEDGPEEVFFIDSIGKGYGPPVISNDLMYFTGALDSLSVLYCYDLNGNRLWQEKLGPEWVLNYPGSRSSPTIVEDLIYVGTGMAKLLCIDKTTHDIIWEKNAVSGYDAILPLFGHSESPVIFNDMVFWTVGGNHYNVIALDRFTGELRWSSEGMKERSAYNPPRVISTPGGRNIFVTFSAYHMMGFDVEDGELLWTHEQDNFPPDKRKPGYGDTHANTILYKDGYIYYTEGDGNCCVKLSLSDDGTEIQQIWRNKDFDSYMGGFIKIGSYLYGSGTAKPQLLSLYSDTGVISDSLEIGRGTIIAVDNKIYYYTQRGTVYLVDYNNGSLKTMASFKINKGSREHFSHPLIHKGVLYIRHGNAIMGYSIKKDQV